MVNDINLVTSFIPREENITLANGATIKSIGRGDLGPLTGVMVAPDLDDSLINISDFDKLDYHFHYGGGQVHLLDKSPLLSNDWSIIATGHLYTDGLYYFPKIN
jgi:hypothetical protein